MTKRDIAVYAIVYLEQKVKELKHELQSNNNFRIHLKIAEHEQELKYLNKMF